MIRYRLYQYGLDDYRILKKVYGKLDEVTALYSNFKEAEERVLVLNQKEIKKELKKERENGKA